MKPSEQLGPRFFEDHYTAFLFFALFLLLSYLLLSPGYNYLLGDSGVYGHQTKTLYETNRIDLSGSYALTVGQLVFGNVFAHIFGFKLKVLHWAVYFADFLCLLAMYLLLIELDVDKFLAFFGSLALIVNPVSIKLVDTYMTEPFFMAYLIFSLYFFTKGLKTGRSLYLYLGSVFGILAVFTRQHAVCISLALILLYMLYRKNFKQVNLWHYFTASLLPLSSVGLFYLIIFWQKRYGAATVHLGSASENLAIIKNFVHPVFLFKQLYFGSLFFLHYSVLYATPLFITLLICLLLNPKRFKDLLNISWIFNVSILWLSIGTIILFFKDRRLMPYLPSIFRVGTFTTIFRLHVMNKHIAAIVLTIMTFLGALLILIQILNHFFARQSKARPAPKKRPHPLPDTFLGREFIYLWGIMYILTSILVGLRYDRYILPVSIFIIYVLLSQFLWIKENKKVIVIVFMAIYSIFVFKLINFRLSLDLRWQAAESLLKQGIDPVKIHGGLGFNNYYSADAITALYRKVKTPKPINWRHFHPMAIYFVKGGRGLEKRRPDLKLLNTFNRQRLWGLFKTTASIYKRKDSCRNPIWL